MSFELWGRPAQDFWPNYPLDLKGIVEQIQKLTENHSRATPLISQLKTEVDRLLDDQVLIAKSYNDSVIRNCELVRCLGQTNHEVRRLQAERDSCQIECMDKNAKIEQLERRIACAVNCDLEHKVAILEEDVRERSEVALAQAQENLDLANKLHAATCKINRLTDDNKKITNEFDRIRGLHEINTRSMVRQLNRDNEALEAQVEKITKEANGLQTLVDAVIAEKKVLVTHSEKHKVAAQQLRQHLLRTTRVLENELDELSASRDL